MNLPASENPHQQLIEAQLPAWARHTAPQHWQALRESLLPAQGLVDSEAAWFANAAPDLRAAVLASQARLDDSQQALARSLKGLENIAPFAETRLAQRLQAEHQLAVPLRSTELVEIHHLFTFGTYVTRHTQTSLLEAALHNFEATATFSIDSALTLAGDARFEQVRIVGRTTLGDSETWVDIELESETPSLKPLALSPDDFARSCRDLDIGKQYQEHLQACFGRPAVRRDSLALQRDRLRLAADLALLRHDIDGLARDVIEALLGDAAVRCWQPSLFAIALHEALIIDAGARGLLLYLPGDEHVLLQCEGLAGVHRHLLTQLRQPAYRRAFLRYVSAAQQHRFVDRLQQNLEATADLHLTTELIAAPVFAFLHDDHVARLQAEAADLAVPTAAVDAKARQRRIAQWQSLGMDALMLAGFFVPGVGTLMTDVMACQLLGDVYEGYQAWHVGDRHLALQHLEAVGLNLALIGALHGADKVVPKLLGSPLLESLAPVQMPDGSRRLWRPALAGYASDAALAQSSTPNTLGQFAHDGRQFIALEGAMYEVSQDAAEPGWRISHPSDPEAYRPRLEHNGEGAWRTEHEVPQAWSDAQCVRRLGLPTDALDDARLQLAMAISGVDRAGLQAVHLAGEATPVLLSDTVERLALASRNAGVATDAERQLTEAYTGLDTALARRLLARLSADEMADWTAQGHLPAWLRLESEQVSRDLPLVRALQGLHEPRLANPDSERLLLACIERVASWPAELHVQIRAASPSGDVLASLGDENAAQRLLLLRSDSGYERHVGERPASGPLYPEPYQPLYAGAPQSLQLAWGSADALRLRTQQLALAERAHWPQRLWGLAAKRPARRGGLRGGGPLSPLPPLSPLASGSVEGRLRRLYPAISPAQIQQLQADWRRALVVAEHELQVREAALQQLRDTLARWAASTARRQRASVRILDAWRRNAVRWLGVDERIHWLNLANLELENHDLAALALPDGFNHIMELDLSGNSLLSEVPGQWLQRMAQVRRLMLKRCRFDRLPQLAQPATLEWLDIEHNRITWDNQAQATLEQWTALRVLDLSDNPLLNAPDMSHTPSVTSLFMVNCSLTRLPQGLERLRSALFIDLSDNQFQRLPSGFILPPATADAVSLESAALGLPIREQIEDYYQQHGVDLLVAVTDYQELLADASARRLQLWARVPLQYRRDLRLLIEDIGDHDTGLQALWRCLERMDTDPRFRERALAAPATSLLEL
ncbi:MULTISPECIES: dermonecrotic toxin domain-containing protein [unclassified Pseudomonas]|uniref:dermonecrotic toxin domain-containing protein n=1 Tax=unclassified Pseudomonas TaxID=196821 RepID=UPI00257C855E|nr:MULTISPECIES: DUF6543 domain-containing protein [unclassified Pseudomonas]